MYFYQNLKPTFGLCIYLRMIFEEDYTGCMYENNYRVFQINIETEFILTVMKIHKQYH